MSFYLQDSERKQRDLKSYLAFAIVLILLYAVVCTPINLIMTSNVLMMETVLPIALDVLMNFMNFAFYWVSFAYLIRFLYQYGFSKSKGFVGFYCVLVAARYTANLVMSFTVIGFPPLDSFISFYLPFFFLDIFLDLLQLLLAFVLSNCVAKLTKNGIEAYMPFEKIINCKNDLSKNLLRVACIPATLSLLARLFYDFHYGLPVNLIDLIWMITYYLSDLLSVLIGYIVMLLVLNRIYARDISE